jgi:excisionase family DNA binding protein
MTTQLDSATAAKRSQLLKVSDVAQLLNVKPRTIYEMVAQHRIPYRKPPGTNILRFDSKKSLSGRAEKTMSLLSEMSVDVPKPRALDATAANVCADRRRKTKAPPFVLPF